MKLFHKEEKEMSKVVILSFVLAQLFLTGCGNKDKNVGMPPQACGAGVPSQYCLPVQNINNNGPQQQNYQWQQNQTGAAPEPGIACSPQDPNACAGSGGFCQPLSSSPDTGYCVAN